MQITERFQIDTKEQILKKARKLFAKQGFDGVSIRSICEKATCNVSAVSYHFGSKEELYRACLSEDSFNVLQLIDNILTPPENPADFKVKLKLFLTQFFEYSIDNKDLILMISKDVNSKHAMESIHKIFRAVPEKLTIFFEAAINQGIVRNEIDPAVLCDHFTQFIFVHTLFAEVNKTGKMRNALDPAFRQHLIEQQLLVILDGIKTAD